MLYWLVIFYLGSVVLCSGGQLCFLSVYYKSEKLRDMTLSSLKNLGRMTEVEFLDTMKKPRPSIIPLVNTIIGVWAISMACLFKLDLIMKKRGK